MSRFQVDPLERVAIHEFEPGTRGDEAPNVIYIRARMNVELTDKVRGDALRVTTDANGQAKEDQQLGVYLTNLLLYNIVAWEGPDFADLPCTPETIRKLPGNDPFIERVRNEIARRNQAKPSPLKNSLAGAGSSMPGEIASKSSEPASTPRATVKRGRPSASTNGILPLHSDSVGRRNK